MKETSKSILEKLKEDKFVLFSLSVYAFLFLFFCSKMSPLYPTNEWEDINVYFNIGKSIFEGRTLYSEVFDPKGPFIFLFYGVGYVLSNTSFIALYFFFVIGWIFALYAIFKTGMLILKGQKTFALVTTLLTPILALKYLYYGGSAEEIILIAQCISLYFFVRYYNSKDKDLKPQYMLVHGITTAIIIFTKINLILFCFFPLLGIFVGLLFQKRFELFFKSALYYILGFIIIAFPICFYLWYNAALEEAFNTYIVLNKHLAVTVSIDELVKNGVARFYSMFRDNLIGAMLAVIGIFYFPIKYIENSIGKIAFVLSGIAMIGIIFFAGVFHFYYPLPIYIFAPLGLITVLSWVNKHLPINLNKKLAYFFIISGLLIAINITSFFDMGGGQIARLQEPGGPAYQFKHRIDKEKNPTLLNLAFGNTIGIYTICDIVPNTRFFTALNIFHEHFPLLRDEQTKYIENRDVQFITLDNFNPNYDHFVALEAMQKNYNLIDSCMIEKTYIEGRFHMYYLYQRND